MGTAFACIGLMYLLFAGALVDYALDRFCQPHFDRFIRRLMVNDMRPRSAIVRSKKIVLDGEL